MRLHPHPRDFQIRFEEEGHRYFLGGAQCRGSVTALIHAFSHPLNSDEVIAKMRCSTNWPMAGYLRDPIPTERLSRLSVAEPALCALLFGSPRNAALICSLLQRLRVLLRLEQDALDLAMSDDDIKIRWAANEAARYGTWMHWLFEAYLNGHVVPTASQELRMMQSFLREELADVEVWRTEWVLYGEEENLAGSIDFCGKLPDGTYVLVDWKRTFGLAGKYHSKQSVLPPVSHLPDCVGMRYRLQLNCYRYILQKYYSVQVRRMIIVCCHPEHFPRTLADEVAVLEVEASALMSAWQSQQQDVRGGSGSQKPNPLLPKAQWRLQGSGTCGGTHSAKTTLSKLTRQWLSCGYSKSGIWF